MPSFMAIHRNLEIRNIDIVISGHVVKTMLGELFRNHTCEKKVCSDMGWDLIVELKLLIYVSKGHWI